MNNTSKENGESAKAQVHLAEFSALREEITRRSNSQYSIGVLGITGLATLLTFAIKERCPELLAAAPYLAAYVGFRWVAQANAVSVLARYIRELSDKLSDLLGERVLAWERWDRSQEELHPYRRRIYKNAWMADAVLYGSSAVLSLAVPLTVLTAHSAHSVVFDVFILVAWAIGAALLALAILEVRWWRRAHHRVEQRPQEKEVL